ncbi:beta-carotene 15,15'-monooxygenase [Rummeliibacillus sp. NPDC094406]|uniref:beta-carotene 15,15'-monooxygenase n=1 Tax=Rummeliibacillus sp. NPDC094406 TaxID=3364511 RepID=UPI003800C15C
MTALKSKSVLWLVFGILVITSNYVLYRTSFGMSILPEDTNGVVLGSLVDFIVIAPLTFLLYQKKFTLKRMDLLAASGCIAARFIIPMEHLQPFVAFTWLGFAIEAALFLLEISLLLSLVIYMPKIIRTTKESPFSIVFAFPQSVDQHVKSHRLVHIICSEALMFYYAFFSWRKEPQEGFTLYKNSSYIALQIMMIHAIVIETLGIHWWLHDKSIILSIVLLIFNVYSVFFFLADLQAMRLNPVTFQKNSLLISAGIMKRSEIPYDLVEEIIVDNEILQKKSSKDTLEFIVRDFEKVYPNVLLKLKQPVEGIFYLGIRKKYNQVAIRIDQPTEFIAELRNQTAQKNK